MTRLFSILAVVLATLSLDISSSNANDVVVVCPADFQTALSPWVERRQAEGLAIKVLDSDTDAETLRGRIIDAASETTRYVMLIGDAPVVGAPCNKLKQTPILYRPTTVTSKWGSTAVLSSDLLFGDFDRDDVPEAVVGRLPVDEPGQLSKLISRIIARESSQDFGPWRGRVQLVGGVGGFGFVADRAIESVTRSIVTSVLPTETRTSVAYASPGHAFYPSGSNFTDAVLNRYETGSRFWVYAGHGRITELDRVPNSVLGRPVLDQRSVKKLNRPAGESPIAVMLACYTGVMDAPEDSIAEEMILCDGGPIAVLAGSRVTMPYGNTTAAVGLINGVYDQRLPRLGDAWLNALKQMQSDQPSEKSGTEMMIDALATVVSPTGTVLTDERREHMLLYNLIGDPTLRLNHPQVLSLESPTGVPAGQPIPLLVKSPIDGELTLTVDRPLGSITEGDANATTIASVRQSVSAKTDARVEVKLPDEFQGPLVLRAHVAGDSQWASGAAKTFVRP
ncbi:MAG: C25 family cysteine peptidase [Planctomycetota bacterium]